MTKYTPTSQHGKGYNTKYKPGDKVSILPGNTIIAEVIEIMPSNSISGLNGQLYKVKYNEVEKIIKQTYLGSVGLMKKS